MFHKIQNPKQLEMPLNPEKLKNYLIGGIT
jgi:hypothetical protein